MTFPKHILLFSRGRVQSRVRFSRGFFTSVRRSQNYTQARSKEISAFSSEVEIVRHHTCQPQGYKNLETSRNLCTHPPPPPQTPVPYPGFSTRIKVDGKNVEIGGKRVTRAKGANLLGGSGGMPPRETFKI